MECRESKRDTLKSSRKMNRDNYKRESLIDRVYRNITEGKT